MSRVWRYTWAAPTTAVGLVAGFAALSLLVGSLNAGGWLHFGPVALHGGEILSFAALWGLAFLTVGSPLYTLYLRALGARIGPGVSSSTLMPTRRDQISSPRRTT